MMLDGEGIVVRFIHSELKWNERKEKLRLLTRVVDNSSLGFRMRKETGN